MSEGEDHVLKKIVAHAKKYGFVFPSSEIYDGFGAVYDYGHNGVELKRNIKVYWWDWMTRQQDDIVGIDTAILMHPTTWEASGHVAAFNDPLIDNKDSKKRYRADVLIEEAIAKLRIKIDKEIEKGKKRWGDSFDLSQFETDHPRVQSYKQAIVSAQTRMKAAFEQSDWDGLKQIIIDMDIADPVSGSRHWTDVRQFNLMFATHVGSTFDDATKIYLRPETAQGIFVNFLNVQQSARMKIPFGIAQMGKAFRNEIIARQFIFRMREFEQMEMQFFVKPGEEMRWYAFWKEQRMRWHHALGLGKESYCVQDHAQLAHYANAACDIQFKFPMGFRELEGIHSRTDFDLTRHAQHSGKKIQYFDTEENRHYTPCVIETSIGLDRMFLAVLSHSYCEEKVVDKSQEDAGQQVNRVVLRIPPALAPYKLAILPLTRDATLVERAQQVMNDLRLDLKCYYEDKDTIGRRYRRMDAIGTPFCLTIDHQTLQDATATLRNRDTMTQERMSLQSIKDSVQNACSLQELLRRA